MYVNLQLNSYAINSNTQQMLWRSKGEAPFLLGSHLFYAILKFFPHD